MSKLLRIRKRDKRIVRFDKKKISDAIFKAAQSVGGKNNKTAFLLAKEVVGIVEKKFKTKTPDVEDVQDLVEKVLIEEGHARTAKSYILYREKRRLLREHKKVILGKSIKTELSLNALVLLREMFLRRNEEAMLLEMPDDMFMRVAKNVAKADRIYDKKADTGKTERDFYELMHSLDFLPNTPTLMNAGTKVQQLVASYVLPVPDAIDGIFDSVKNSALLQKTGAGTGFSFSELRPENDIVFSTSGLSSGPLSFMEMFDRTTDVIKEGGRKRGANMGILNINHPDIEKFITAKANEDLLTNFNLSVSLTKDFMERYKKGKEIELINPRNKKTVRKVKARDLFNMIVHFAWKTGDPGLLFIDTINKDNPLPLKKINATDSCASQPLLPYESAVLGSINLANMVKNRKIDFERIREAVRKSVHFMDNVIDVNKYPLKKMEEMSKATRKIGLGVMGFADMLYQLEISYASEECIKTAEKLMAFIDKEAKHMSLELAKKRGVFPSYKESIHYKKKMGMRNAAVTTISPAGTISLIADVSSGIEPNFALCIVKKVLDNNFLFLNRFFEKIFREKDFYSEDLVEKVKNRASIADMKDIPKNLRKVFVLVNDITAEQQIKVQAAFQKHTDNGVSKTVNFPKNGTEEDIKNVFLLAYKLRCKGISIYRQESKKEEIIELI